jgi:chromate transporter
MLDADLLPLAGLFTLLSLLSVGGGPRLMAPLAHEVVSVHHWMAGEALTGLYGLSRLLPGAGGLVLLAGLVGWTVAGIAGAVVMPMVLLLPSTLVCYAAIPAWQARPGAPWKATLARAVAPVAVGQGLAGGIAILQYAQAGRGGLLLAGAALLARSAGAPAPLILIAGGIVTGALGGLG